MKQSRQIKWEIVSNFCALFRMSELYLFLLICIIFWAFDRDVKYCCHVNFSWFDKIPSNPNDPDCSDYLYLPWRNNFDFVLYIYLYYPQSWPPNKKLNGSTDPNLHWLLTNLRLEPSPVWNLRQIMVLMQLISKV